MISFPYDSFFGKLELGDGKILSVCFVEFSPLSLRASDLEEKKDFKLGHITVIEGDVSKSSIDES